MLSTPKLAVFSFGCPRSGTTLVKHALQIGVGFFYVRMGEYTSLHPINSDHGLVDLTDSLSRLEDRRVLFVRTVRHPLEICKSAWVAWYQGEWRTTEQVSHPVALQPDMVCGVIRRESKNTALQAPNVDIVQVRYEDLLTPDGQAAFARSFACALGKEELWIQNEYLLLGFLAKYAGKEPIGEGRMALGDKAMPVPENWLAGCAKELSDVIAFEGYA